MELVKIASTNWNYLNCFVNTNDKIKNVSFMKSLKILYADFNCGIDQNGIKNLNLVKISTFNNYKITNVSFMKSLKIYY